MTVQTNETHGPLTSIRSSRAARDRSAPSRSCRAWIASDSASPSSSAFPTPRRCPRREVAAATTRVLGERGRAALQYGDNAGYSGLIDALIAKLARDQGIQASRENILITAGGSQAHRPAPRHPGRLGRHHRQRDADLARRRPGVPQRRRQHRLDPGRRRRASTSPRSSASCTGSASRHRSRSSSTPTRTFRIRPAPRCPCGVATICSTLARAAGHPPDRGRRLLRPALRRRVPARDLLARRQRLRRLHGHPLEDDGSRHAARLAGRTARAHPRASPRSRSTAAPTSSARTSPRTGCPSNSCLTSSACARSITAAAT